MKEWVYKQVLGTWVLYSGHDFVSDNHGSIEDIFRSVSIRHKEEMGLMQRQIDDLTRAIKNIPDMILNPKVEVYEEPFMEYDPDDEY